MSAAVFEERIDPGQLASALLAVAVHLLLFAVLVFGVRWQNRPPESVAVELWEAPPPAPAPVVEAPKPLPKPEPVPAPVVKAEPVKPEPVLPKPQIVEKKAPPVKVKPVPKPLPKPAPKVMPKVEAKPVLKPEPLRPRVDDTRRIREELAREQASFAIRDQLARDAAAARSNALADWVNKVRAKIRGNIVLPPDIKGNPETVLEVVQLPNGEVLSAKVRRSSGSPALDNAIERAILKSSPLPRPDRGEPVPRSFELRYRPLD